MTHFDTARNRWDFRKIVNTISKKYAVPRPEVEQEALIALWLAQDSEREVKDEMGYVYIATRNRVLEGIKFMTRGYHVPLEYYGAATHSEPEEFDKLVSKVTKKRQRLLSLRFNTGYSIEELAGYYGTPKGTIKSRLSRAVTAVRNTTGAELR